MDDTDEIFGNSELGTQVDMDVQLAEMGIDAVEINRRKSFLDFDSEDAETATRVSNEVSSIAGTNEEQAMTIEELDEIVTYLGKSDSDITRV